MGGEVTPILPLLKMALSLFTQEETSQWQRISCSFGSKQAPLPSKNNQQTEEKSKLLQKQCYLKAFIVKVKVKVFMYRDHQMRQNQGVITV